MRFKYGNKEYPNLFWGDKKVIDESWGVPKFRITERGFERLITHYGYEPEPEMLVRRYKEIRIGFFQPYLGFWLPYRFKTFSVNINENIKSSCFGYTYDYSETWQKHNLNKL